MVLRNRKQGYLLGFLTCRIGWVVCCSRRKGAPGEEGVGWGILGLLWQDEAWGHQKSHLGRRKQNLWNAEPGLCRAEVR